MFEKQKLGQAIVAICAIGAIHSPANAQVSQRIEEMVVTATKRSASTQDIPIAVQALGEDELDHMNVGNFSDYVRLLPNVNFGGRGPGQNNVYIRGVSTDQVAVQSAEVAGSAPTVALYLDEAPVTAVGRNLDVYVSDMSRVEVLPGPQGTLFGASSQAGTVRFITNKPQYEETTAQVDMSSSNTRHGAPSFGVEGVLNIPVGDDLAFRISMYNVNYGGYIDNVQGSIRMPTQNPSFPAGAELREATNAELVEDDFNESGYSGLRVGAKWAINDDWELLVQNMTQKLTADGVFDYDPEIGELEVMRFYEDELVDEFNLTSVTLEGHLGMLDVIYAGSYLDREAHQSIDYSGYANVGPFIPYYLCEYPSYATCEAPVLGYRGEVRNSRMTHEFRVSTDPANPLSFTGGIYYDDSEVINLGEWIYEGVIQVGFGQNSPIEGASNNNPNPRDPGVAFFNDITRNETQVALFGELTYVVSDYVSLTAGFRAYDIELEMLGSSNFINRGDTDLQWGINLDDVLDPANETGNVGKFTVNVTPTDESLIYLTYSEGFRPGGFNRQPTEVVPKSYESDTLNNFELGWKTTLFDGKTQFNGSLYRMDWSDIQTGVFNPGPVEEGGSGSNIVYTITAGSAEITGLEGDIIYLATDNLSFSIAFSINDSEIKETPEGADNIVAPGNDLALTPKTQGKLKARYEYEYKGLDAYWQLVGTYKASSYTSIVIGERFEMESYALFDGAVGIGSGEWNVELFGQNLTDERAELFISNMDDIPRTVTNRPLTVGMRVRYMF